jgi:hypothetical protein
MYCSELLYKIVKKFFFQIGLTDVVFKNVQTFYVAVV